MDRQSAREELDRMRFALQGESPWDRMKRKSKDEPFVPAGKYPPCFTLSQAHPFDDIGVALTCFALVAATVGIKTGNKVYANHMFRLRGIGTWLQVRG